MMRYYDTRSLSLERARERERGRTNRLRTIAYHTYHNQHHDGRRRRASFSLEARSLRQFEGRDIFYV